VTQLLYILKNNLVHFYHFSEIFWGRSDCEDIDFDTHQEPEIAICYSDRKYLYLRKYDTADTHRLSHW